MVQWRVSVSGWCWIQLSITTCCRCRGFFVDYVRHVIASDSIVIHIIFRALYYLVLVGFPVKDAGALNSQLPRCEISCCASLGSLESRPKSTSWVAPRQSFAFLRAASSCFKCWSASLRVTRLHASNSYVFCESNHVPGACNFAKRISTERAQSNIGRLNGITCISPHGWQRQLFKVRVACQANRTCNMLVLEQPGAKIDSASFDLYLKKLGRSGCFTQSS